MWFVYPPNNAATRGTNCCQISTRDMPVKTIRLSQPNHFANAEG